MENVFEKFENLKERLYDAAFSALGGSDPERISNPYNTDIIIWDDGRITTHDYFGNVIYTANDIVCVLTISGNEKNNWADFWKEGMTDAQIDFCEKKGWTCCYESNSPNPEDWEEYEITVGDLMELDENLVEQCIEQYLESLSEQQY